MATYKSNILELRKSQILLLSRPYDALVAQSPVQALEGTRGFEIYHVLFVTRQSKDCNCILYAVGRLSQYLKP